VDLDLGRALDHVEVRHHETVAADDEAAAARVRAERIALALSRGSLGPLGSLSGPARRALLVFLLLLPEAGAEEELEGIHALTASAGTVLDRRGLDRDHCGIDRLGKVGEARQRSDRRIVACDLGCGQRRLGVGSPSRNRQVEPAGQHHAEYHRP
jgi:hypothetical protein